MWPRWSSCSTWTSCSVKTPRNKVLSGGFLNITSNSIHLLWTHHTCKLGHKAHTCCARLALPLKCDDRLNAPLWVQFEKTTIPEDWWGHNKGERKKERKIKRLITGSAVVKRIGSSSLRDKRHPASCLMGTYQVHSSAAPCATRSLLMARRGGCRLSDSWAVQRGRGRWRLLWMYGRCRKEVETCESLSPRLLTTVSTLPFHCCERSVMDVHLQGALRRAGALCKCSCRLLVF